MRHGDRSTRRWFLRVAVAVMVLSAATFSSMGPDSGADVPVAAEIAARVTYQPPVDAPVIDGFRMDNGPYGAGNRGLEYGTRGGEPVFATASGEVTFVGMVAGRLVLTLAHADGRLSSLTHLESVAVSVGELVDGGAPIGTASAGLHFGVREDGHYIDPAMLFGDRPERRRRGHAYLVEP